MIPLFSFISTNNWNVFYRMMILVTTIYISVQPSWLIVFITIFWVKRVWSRFFQNELCILCKVWLQNKDTDFYLFGKSVYFTTIFTMVLSKAGLILYFTALLKYNSCIINYTHINAYVRWWILIMPVKPLPQ